MNFTLFGYPKTGKTTLFNLLTGSRLEGGAFEEGKKEPSLRSCPLPDPRLDRIAEIYKEKKKTPAVLELADLAGISSGEVKTSSLLGVLHKADGLLHVVRGFADEAVFHSRPVDPQADIRSMEEELVLADFLSIQTRLERLEKDLKKAKSADWEKEKEILEKLAAAAESGGGIRDVPLAPAEEKLIRSFAFLSQKPLVHLINADDREAGRLEDPALWAGPGRTRGEVMAFCGRVESELLELEPSEAEAFRAAYGLKRPTRDRFLEAAPRLLDTLAFFTIGKDEVRSWLVKSGSSALAASGAIHSDIEKGFIRAEVIGWQELAGHGSLQAAKEKGAVRLEGRDYIVRDGDVLYFRFAS